MATSILVLRNNQQTGPFSEEAVRQMLADGRLAATDLAWREGMAEWKPLSETIASVAPPVYAAAPMATAAGGGSSALKWGLAAGGLVTVLAFAGIGAWQYSEHQKLEVEKQRIALDQRRMEEEQARAEEERKQEEQRKAEAEKQRLEEEKQAAEEKSRELEQRLEAERRESARERQRQQRQQQQMEAQQQQQMRQQQTNSNFPYGSSANNSPYGTPPPPPPQNICRECGVVQYVRAIQQQGDASGTGAVIGGVAGGLLGNQVGRGKGKDAATIVGALGGAVAGHQIEKARSATTSYEVTVRFDDGMTRTFNSQQAWQQGARVRMYNGGLVGGY